MTRTPRWRRCVLSPTAGGQAIVQWTPYGLGRRAELLPGISSSTGVSLVAATGLHRREHYPEGFVDGVRDRLAEIFVRELTVGIGNSSVRAGLIKVAGGFHVLDAHAELVMRAAAEAHHATGAPIAIHHELGSAADAVLDLLVDKLDVPPSAVILGHLNRFPDHRGAPRVGRSGVRGWRSTGRRGRITRPIPGCWTAWPRWSTPGTPTGCCSAATRRPPRPAARPVKDPASLICSLTSGPGSRATSAPTSRTRSSPPTQRVPSRRLASLTDRIDVGRGCGAGRQPAGTVRA